MLILKRFLHFLKYRLDTMLFSGKVGVLFCALYGFLLLLYRVSGDKPTNGDAQKLIHSNSVFIYIFAYVILIAVSLWKPMTGSTFATCFIGFTAAISNLRVITLTSVSIALICLSLPLFAAHGLIVWYTKKENQFIEPTGEGLRHE